MRLFRFAVIAVAFLSSCREEQSPPKKEEPKIIDCKAGDPSEISLLPAGRVDEKSAILPDGRLVMPAGRQVKVGRFPMGLEVPDDGAVLFVGNVASGSISVIDAASAEVRQDFGGVSNFAGLAYEPSSRKLYVAGADKGKVFRLAFDGASLSPDGEIALSGYISSIALPAGGRALYAVESANSLFYIVDLRSGESRTLEVGTFPYDVAVSRDGEAAYVSNWSSGTVTAVDLVHEKVAGSVKVGKNPEGLAVSADGSTLYVAASDADELWVIDTRSLAERSVVSLRGEDNLLAGAPNAVALDERRGRIYVAMAERNCVEIVSIEGLARLGRIPAGWFPTRLKVSADGSSLFVVNSKGFGSDFENGQSELRPAGTVSIISAPKDEAEIYSHTSVADQCNGRPAAYYETDCRNIVPIPTREDEVSPIKHVLLIVRENKTYDQVLGDFERGDGDPELCIAGKELTPNLHRLAGQFTNTDNFYSDAEVSVTGHMWTTQADCNDFVEKTWHNQLPLAGYDPVTLSAGGTIFDLCYAHGVSFRNYGEVVGFGVDTIGKYKEFVDYKYPFFNMDVLDVDKAREFLREFELGVFPNFVYMLLPNDHTFGTTAGKPTPESMIADNDEATGMILEAISRSEHWPETAVFIIEDDPQSWSGDHVDAHRSICVAVSPWVRHGYTSHVHYSVPSLYRTIEMILGLPPMNRNDAGAAPMYDMFTSVPDYSTYTSVPVRVERRANTLSSPMAEESGRIDFSRPDNAAGLGRILWRYFKGERPPPPYAKGIDE